MDAREFRERLRSIARERSQGPPAEGRKGSKSAPFTEVWPATRDGGLTIARPPWPEAAAEPAVDNLPYERACVVDIEAMGLCDLPVFLVGFAVVTSAGVKIEQFLAEHPDEEPAMLSAVAGRVREADACITYNGRTYDFPLLSARCTYCRVKWPGDLRHIDMLYLVRKRMGTKFTDCRLATVEAELVGITRRQDISAESVPELYRRYIADGNGRTLVPVLEHNLMDIAATALVYLELARRFPGDFERPKADAGDNQEALFNDGI